MKRCKYGSKALHETKGFTTTELLIAVAILVVLFALVAPNLIKMQKDLRQKELDTKAETIYIAAQNQLVKLRASGQSYKYSLDSNKNLLVNKDGEGLGTPSDMIPEYDENGELDQDLHYFYGGASDSDTTKVATAVMNEKTVDGELLAHHWVIEYDPTNCNVYAVYYSEAWEIEPAYASDWKTYDSYRERTKRYDAGAWVGYYGGDATASSAETTVLNPSITVNNAEKLTVHMQCKAPLSAKDIVFTVKMTDGEGNENTRIYKTGKAVKKLGLLYYLDLTLDDLSSSDTLDSRSTRFRYLYGSTPSIIPHSGYDGASKVFYSETGKALVPGTELKIKVTVSSSNSLVEDGDASATTNSLFADSSTPTEAHVLYGRHLQNLDESSGVNNKIVSAVQRGNISFKDDTDKDDDWFSYYSGTFFNNTAQANNSGITTANFKPIHNTNLKSYNGSHESNRYRIAGLNVSSANNSALFESVAGGVSLTNVTLTGANVSASDGAAAALVGTSSGEGNKIQNCHVYLERVDYQGKTEKNIWLSGKSVGGLVGSIANGSLTVSNSLAASVIDGDEWAGGLIGNVTSGSLYMESSYADSYIYGKKTAGLANGNVKKLSNCYAAGFQVADEVAAGMVIGTVNEASSSYTICVMGSSENSTANCYSTATDIGTSTAVYYFAPGTTSGNDVGGTNAISSISSSALLEALGNVFTMNNASASSPYNLMGQALATYDYPRISALRHYGDWRAEFEAGSLVYYEKYTYSDGTDGFGFYGANVDALANDTTIVGDGYGIVYRQDEAIPQTVTVAVGESPYTLDMTNYYTVVADDKEYHVFPLPKEAIDITPLGENFYQETRITTSAVGSTTEVYGFNPHFAKTAKKATEENGSIVLPHLEEGEAVSVRTARHLYDMSRYYDANYRTGTSTNVFMQECDIDYAVYDWTNFTALSSVVTNQEPIGKDADNAFNTEYDGGYHIITNVSFISKSGNYIGLIGYNEGSVHDVVVAVEYNSDDSSTHFLTKREEPMQTNDTVCMGVLVGRNMGTIDNCAVAGYYLAGADGTLHAYANSTLYAGGLVGVNTGVVRNCSAECPTIRLSSLYAQVRLGGFVGLNEARGRISNSYDLGYVEVAESRGGQVNASGFAGLNEGRISSSYCATAIITSGETATSYAFAPNGGVINGCYYLDQGTYRYIHNLYSYKGVADRTSGQSATYESMRGSYATNVAATSLYHRNTSEETYPFCAVVRNESGDYVHYGDWVDGPVMGNLGVFYWEYEEGGSNSGYHITYIGTSDDMSDSGTTLCTAHDDGGAITEYGYGYYVDSRYEDRVRVSASGLNTSIDEQGGGPGVYNTSVAAALKEQMKTFSDGKVNDYTFYPYTTQVADDSQNHVYLENGEAKTGTWTLTFTGIDNITTSYTYEIAPFFANAMRRTNSSEPLNMTASDWRTTDYAQEPGLEDNVFEVRSVQQLEYINWNYKTKNCDTLVFGQNGKTQTRDGIGNYMDFPYLQYATVVSLGTQKKTDVERLRPTRNWVQSHDLHGTQGQNLTPIAGMATSTPVSGGDYQNILFAWFGGSYDGQSYKIQNVNVSSEAYTVGLFGATAGASIKNIIMFADDGTSTIERTTAGKTAVDVSGQSINFEEGPGAYSLGGLIGIAYDYKTSGSASANSIENCAIAGYIVKDSSTNKQGAGTANVGGLIGFANVNLVGCSSVVQTNIASTHNNGHMCWGSYYRIGGLAGSAGCPGNVSVSVKNCYTGGSITVDDETLNEMPEKFNGNGFALRDSNNVGYSSNLFIAGIIGGSYAPNISNFSNQKSNSPDGIANIENCYTYLQLPALKGTIRAISLIAAQADRYNRATQINVSNCYYLDSISNIEHPDRDNPLTWPGYFFSQSANQVSGGKAPTEAEWAILRSEEDTPQRRQLIEKYKKLVISEGEFNQMLMGDLTCLRKYLNEQTKDSNKGKIPPKEEQKLINFDALAASGAPQLLNTSSDDKWGKVTVVDDSGAAIDGKYSFSSESSQTGKNYPFPTIITQKDNTYSTRTSTKYVNVHYGAWPLNGWYWENGRDSMDIFEDMDTDHVAKKTFTLHYGEDYSGDPTFTVSDESIATVESCVKDEASSCYKVTIMALKEGYVTVEAESGATSASFVLNITAKLKLSSDPAKLELYKDTAANVVFTAVAALPADKDLPDGVTRKDYSTDPNGTWSINVVDEEDRDYFDWKQNASKPNEWNVTCYAAGERLLRVTFDYQYSGNTYSDSLLLTTNTKGVIGLSNGTDFVEANRISKGTATGEATTISNMGAPTTWQMYLYGSSMDGDFKNFAIEDVSVAMAEGSQGNASDYKAFFNDMSESVSGAEYMLLQGNVLYMGNDGNPQKVVVTARLKDPNGASEYTLSVPVESIEKYTVHFDANGGTGMMADVPFDGQTEFELPKCAFTKTGYTFKCWKVGDNEYEVGSKIPVTGYTVVEAIWEANGYTVHFDANGGTGSIEGQELTYDVEETLTQNNDQITYANHDFAGWNTQADGKGTSYEDGALVKNLAAEGKVTLYAQWISKAMLTLENTTYGQSEPNVIWTGAPSGNQLNDYTMPVLDGWTLDGWYTAKSSSAVKVINDDGTAVPSVAGYTNANGEFDLSEDKTLYARWKGQGYLQVNKLEKGDQDNGTYAIVNSNAIGVRKLMSVNGTSLGSTDVELLGATAYDSNNNEYTTWINGNLENNKQWKLTHKRDNNGINFYSVESVTNITKKYLRGNTDKTVVLTDTLLWNGNISNKQMWTYGNQENAMQCENQLFEDKKYYCLYLNGSTWRHDINKTAYIFKLQELYTYDPVVS